MSFQEVHMEGRGMSGTPLLALCSAGCPGALCPSVLQRPSHIVAPSSLLSSTGVQSHTHRQGMCSIAEAHPRPPSSLCWGYLCLVAIPGFVLESLPSMLREPLDSRDQVQASYK